MKPTEVNHIEENICVYLRDLRFLRGWAPLRSLRLCGSKRKCGWTFDASVGGEGDRDYGAGVAASAVYDRGVDCQRRVDCDPQKETLDRAAGRAFIGSGSEPELVPAIAGNLHRVGEEDLAPIDPHRPVTLVGDVEHYLYRIGARVGETDKRVEGELAARIAAPHEGRKEVDAGHRKAFDRNRLEGLAAAREHRRSALFLVAAEVDEPAGDVHGAVGPEDQPPTSALGATEVGCETVGGPNSR